MAKKKTGKKPIFTKVTSTESAKNQQDLLDKNVTGQGQKRLGSSPEGKPSAQVADDLTANNTAHLNIPKNYSQNLSSSTPAPINKSIQRLQHDYEHNGIETPFSGSDTAKMTAGRTTGKSDTHGSSRPTMAGYYPGDNPAGTSHIDVENERADSWHSATTPEEMFDPSTPKNDARRQGIAESNRSSVVDKARHVGRVVRVAAGSLLGK